MWLLQELHLRKLFTTRIKAAKVAAASIISILFIVEYGVQWR